MPKRDGIFHERPADVLYRLWRDFRRERDGAQPSAILMNGADWKSLARSVDLDASWLRCIEGHSKVFGMTPLLTAHHPCGFPLCLDAAAADEAIRAGARAA